VRNFFLRVTLIDLAVVAPLVLGAIGLFRWGRRRIEA
jgi:hypothetical protein